MHLDGREFLARGRKLCRFLTVLSKSLSDLREKTTFGIALLFCLIAITHLESAEPPPPNVIVILTDDQGWGDLSVHGNTNLHTPNIDALARDGALFERFYVCPVCSPTRAEFLTGRYHPRSGVYSTSNGGERLDLDEVTIGQMFKATGYATGAFGKWHNGMQYPYHPTGRGFDEFYGFCSGHWGHYFSPVLEHNGRLVRGKGFVIDDFTDHALEFIERHRGQPFFCYLPLNTPHSPMQVPDRFFDSFDGKLPGLRHREPDKENLPMTRAALAMCENIDWNVGRLLRKLDDLHLNDNTIVVYFADNGPNSWRWNGGMRGRKGSTDEGGVRAPLLIRWPGHIAPGTRIAPIAAATDLLPTLADLTGVDATGGKPLDGISVQPLLTGDSENWPDRMIFSHWRGRVSVRTQRFRLDHKGKLYDMLADPGQQHDVATVHAQTTSRLTQAASEWKDTVVAELRQDDRPFPVGYREFPITHLPARDGVPHGGMQRSARFPNCSFLTHWTDTSDYVTWDIRVETAGRYEVVVHYTCGREDVGATIELSLGQARVGGRVTESHDSPLVGAHQDRVPRIESLVKDFKPLRLGVIALEKGRGELSLRALEIPGEQAMDVRYVVLTLLDD